MGNNLSFETLRGVTGWHCHDQKPQQRGLVRFDPD